MFYIQISNGLLKDGHRKRMGEAVWEFMWCLDRMTSINEQGIGLVLGGRPILLKEISKDSTVHVNTVSRNLQRLVEHKYLIIIRTPRGLVIRINKAQKRFKKVDKLGKVRGKADTNPKRDSPSMVRGFTIHGESNIRQSSYITNTYTDKFKNFKHQKTKLTEKLSMRK